ncbi:MAG: YbaN family protein [Tissierellaceae bacterium]
MKRIIYIVLGCIGLILSVIGAIVPILPAFPFVVLTAFAFGKSSERLHDWFLETNLYKNNFKSLVKGRSMTIQAKIKVIASITISLSIGAFMVGRISSIWFVAILRIILGLVWLGHFIYFVFRVETISKEELNLKYNLSSK